MIRVFAAMALGSERIAGIQESCLRCPRSWAQECHFFLSGKKNLYRRGGCKNYDLMLWMCTRRTVLHISDEMHEHGSEVYQDPAKLG